MTELRPLADILKDVTEHSFVNASHTATCACMKPLIAEIRDHFRAAVPPRDPVKWEAVQIARWRISYVIRSALRDM